MTRIVRFAALLTGLALVPLAFAQRPEPLPAPSLDVWSHGNVLVSVRLPDSRVVIGGDFRAIDGVPRDRLALLAADGTLDPDWNPGADGSVRALVVADDGALLVGGEFQSIGNAPIRHLAKLSIEGYGAADPAWRPDPDAPVYGLALGANGSLFVAGGYSSIGGRAQRRLAKLSIGDARADPLWDPSVGPSHAGVDALAYDAGADLLYFAGGFASVDGVERRNIARVAGSGTGALDAAWQASAEFGASTLVVGNGSVYAAGSDFLYSVYPFARIARYSVATGAADTEFANSIATFGSVDGLALSANGLYVAGNFYVSGGSGVSTLARIDAATGALDPWFEPVVESRAFHVALHDGTLDVATNRGYARRTIGGALAASADAMVPGKVHALAALPDGRTVVGGDFDFVGATPRTNLFMMDAAGALDAHWTPSQTAAVRTLAVDAARGAIYVLGGYGNDQLLRYSAAGAGARDGAWVPDVGNVRALAIGVDGAVFVSGDFHPHANLAKLSAVDGGTDPLWGGTGSDRVAGGLAVAPDGSVFVYGGFDTINGVARRRIAKLDPLIGAVDPDWNASVQTVVGDVAFAGNAIYVAGSFASFYGFNVARYTVSSPSVPDPTFAASLPDGAFVRELAVGDGAVFAHYTPDVHAYGSYRLGKLDASGAVDAQWTPDTAGAVNALLVNAAGDLVVGGEFERIGASTRRGIAALPPTAFATGTLFADGFD